MVGSLSLSGAKKLVLVAAVAASSCGGAPMALLDWSAPIFPSVAPLVRMPALRVDGVELRNSETSERVRLRGVNVCSLEFDRQGTTWKLVDGGSAVLDTLADPARWNANVVRVPVNQQWFLEDDAYVARVEQIIDAANARGLYAILDVQWERAERTEPYSDNILELPTFGTGNTTEAFWLKASSRFATRTNVLYDLINEAHGHSDAETHEAMQVLVNAIRRRNTDTVLVISGMDWAHTVDAYRVKPLKGANLVYSAHQYLPYDPPSGFDVRFARAARVIPVILGEFLAEPDSSSYALAVTDAAEQAGVNGWLPWAIGCGFDESDDQKKEPLTSLAARMRALNP